jgi:hypothetical protein
MGEDTPGSRPDGDGGRQLPPLEASPRELVDALPARWRGYDTARLVGAGLVALWVVWLVVLWVGQVRVGSVTMLEDDLEAGRVLSYREVVLDDRVDQRWGDSTDVGYHSVDEQGRLTDEDDGSGNRAVAYWVEGRVATERVVDPGLSPATSSDAVVERLRAAGVPPNTAFGSDFYGRTDRADQLALVLGVVTLGLVVLGPRPARGTRWFWFWVMSTPLALGVLAYAVVELVRPGHRAGSDAGRPRYPGLAGLVLGWGGGALVAAGLSALADLAPVLLVRP